MANELSPVIAGHRRDLFSPYQGLHHRVLEFGGGIDDAETFECEGLVAVASQDPATEATLSGTTVTFSNGGTTTPTLHLWGRAIRSLGTGTGSAPTKGDLVKVKEYGGMRHSRYYFDGLGNILESWFTGSAIKMPSSIVAVAAEGDFVVGYNASIGVFTNKIGGGSASGHIHVWQRG